MTDLRIRLQRPRDCVNLGPEVISSDICKTRLLLGTIGNLILALFSSPNLVRLPNPPLTSTLPSSLFICDLLQALSVEVIIDVINSSVGRMKKEGWEEASPMRR